MFSPMLARRLEQSDLHIVLTGGGGWLGMAFLSRFRDIFGAAFLERVRVFGSRERSIALSPECSVKSKPLAEILSLSDKPHIIIHCAYLTREHASGGIEGYVRANRQITDTVVEAVRRQNVVGLFVPSSGAVYRPDRSLWTDLEANPYGVLKLEDEARFEEVASAHGVRLLQVRVFNLAGPYINKSYALSSILGSLLNGEEVVLNADHPVIRSYIHVDDLVTLTLAALLDRQAVNLPAFDTAGEVAVEIGELALRAVQALKISGASIRRPEVKAAPVDNYVGDPELLRRLAAYYGIALSPLDVQIVDTARYLKAAKSLSVL